MAKKKTQPIRFAPGEIHVPARPDNPYSYLTDQPRYFAWVEVIQAIARDSSLNENLLGALARDVYPCYVKAANKYDYRKYGPPQPNDLKRLAAEEGSMSPAGRLQASLEAWLQQCSLPTVDMAWIGLQTVGIWQCLRKSPRRSWHLLNETQARPFPSVVRVMFAAEGWNPLTEPRSTALRRILAALVGQVKQYLEDVEAEYKGAERAFGGTGATPTPVKYASEHFDWFIRFQVKGQNFSDIGRAARTGHVNVSRAVHGIGQQLDPQGWQDWARARAKGGKPRGGHR